MAGLLVALGASACADDPSVEFGGDAPTKIQASPTVMFVNQGTPEFMLARLVDDRNRSTPTSFEISNVSAGITVTLDETFRPDFIGSDQLEFNPIQHVHRFIVTGVEAVGGEFTVSSQGISQVVKVNVVPSEIPTSIVAGAAGFLDISSENFTFDMATSFDFGGNVLATPVSVSPDGHTATIVAPPGLNDVRPTITGARASYMPTVALSAAPATTGVSTPATLFGSATYPSARAITVPEGEFYFTDAGDMTGADIFGGGGPLAWYQFVVPADRHFDLTVSWAAGHDLDWYLFDADGNQVAGAGAAGAGPEHASADLVAGTYDLAVVNWCDGCTDTDPVGFIQFHIVP
jgi:hypothetical protein